ncbi:MAG: hypothetical protein C0402_02070 [Thermodesulfovibrio sp.]|nr:hypothetical protein [Thermodesulfovibrio sp.]
MKNRKKLGEMLVEAGVIDDFQLRAALSYQSEWGGRLGSILIKKGILSERELLSAIVEQYGVESVSLDAIEKPPDEVMKLVRVDTAKKFDIFPLSFDGKTLVTAMADPTDLKTIDDISFMLGVRIKPVLALESEISRAIGIHYEGRSPGEWRPETRTVHQSGDRQQPIMTAQENLPKPEFSTRQAVEGLIDLLIDKGLISKEELIRKIVLKGTPHIRIGD